MKFTTFKSIFEDADGFASKSVKVAGWVRTIRNSKEIGFIELNDGTCQKCVQIVFNTELANYDEIRVLTTGSAIIVDGRVVESEHQGQDFEIAADKVFVEGLAQADYPISKKRHGFEYLRSVAHLRGRTNTFSAVFRIRSLMTYAIHEYMRKNDFVYIATPCITTSDGEGAGETFQITTFDLANVPKQNGQVDYSRDFFGRQAFLTVTGQLNVEPFCQAFKNVYTFGPSFRAENSNTTRHVAEFWQVEPEMAFAELPDVMETIESLVKYVINYLLENAETELMFFDKFIETGLLDKLKNTVSEKFAAVTYAEALDILKNSGETFEMPVEWGSFQTEWEKYLAEKVFMRPVFVTDYPKESKAFYMRLNDDGKTVAATDLMFQGIGEIVGASAREERLDILLKRIDECGLNPDDYWWYLDLRRYGTYRHGGFGMGVERLMRYVTGIENIRDVIPFPRTPKSAEF